MTSSPTPAVLPDARALKPCPFCGADPLIEDGENDRPWVVQCMNRDCPAQPFMDHADTKRQAIKAWNTRTTPPAPIAEGVTCTTKPLTDAERQAGVDHWITPPASDAAVSAGALREALQRARETLEVYADPTGYTDNEGEQLTAEDELHPGLLAQHTLEQIAAMLAAAPKVASDSKTLRQVMASGDPEWPGGAVERDAWFAGYDAAVAERTAPKVASDTAQAEIKRLRGLLIDPGTPPWEDARAVLVTELRKAGYSTHADNVEAAHGVLIPSDIALNLIAHATKAKVASDTLPNCTCHPDDRPLGDCPRKGAANYCKVASDTGAGLLAKIEAEARRYASHYPQNSDGRNTFVMFADYVAALATPTDATDGATGGGEGFLEAIHEATPAGEWITVRHTPNGDWAVRNPPHKAFGGYGTDVDMGEEWTFTPDDREKAAILSLCADQELSPTAIMRQALRLYQHDHCRRKDGETVTWSGDDQRARDFAGPLATTTGGDLLEQAARYRHVKRGTVYTVVGEAELQTISGALVDGSALVVYRGKDGKQYVVIAAGGHGSLGTTPGDSVIAYRLD